MLFVLISLSVISSRTQVVSASQLLIHCSVEFIKQVLPRLTRPQTPDFSFNGRASVPPLPPLPPLASFVLSGWTCRPKRSCQVSSSRFVLSLCRRICITPV